MEKSKSVKKCDKRRSSKKTEKKKAEKNVEKTTPAKNRLSDGFDDRMMSSILQGQVTDDVRKEIRETFDLFDADHDGRVSSKEIETIVRSLGMLISDKEMADMLERLDVDGNGTVEFSEFESFMLSDVNKIPDETDQEMLAAFKVLDKDNNGYIDKDELKFFMTKFGDKMSEEDANEMIQLVDKNGDGVIDYKEYVAHMHGNL